MQKLLGIAVLSTLTAACASNWVQLTPDGEQVRLALPADVANCRRVGTSSASALNRIGPMQRGGERLQQELVTLARNEAADMGGNRVVAESTIIDGRQTFGVFSCF